MEDGRQRSYGMREQLVLIDDRGYEDRGREWLAEEMCIGIHAIEDRAFPYVYKSIGYVRGGDDFFNWRVKNWLFFRDCKLIKPLVFVNI